MNLFSEVSKSALGSENITNFKAKPKQFLELVILSSHRQIDPSYSKVQTILEIINFNNLIFIPFIEGK